MYRPRPYQREAIDRADEAWAGGAKKVLIEMATGTGKTVLFGHLARQTIEAGKRVLILAKLGVRRETAMGYTKKQASTVISKLRSTRCTEGQSWKLRRLGFTEQAIQGMNFDKASVAINRAMAGESSAVA